MVQLQWVQLHHHHALFLSLALFLTHLSLAHFSLALLSLVQYQYHQQHQL